MEECLLSTAFEVLAYTDIVVGVWVEGQTLKQENIVFQQLIGIMG